ncbi:MAG: hypothetical protein ACREA0_00440 [bacterium]
MPRCELNTGVPAIKALSFERSGQLAFLHYLHIRRPGYGDHESSTYRGHLLCGVAATLPISAAWTRRHTKMIEDNLPHRHRLPPDLASGEAEDSDFPTLKCAGYAVISGTILR